LSVVLAITLVITFCVHSALYYDTQLTSLESFAKVVITVSNGFLQQGDIAFHFGTRVLRVKAVSLTSAKSPIINWLPQQRPLDYCETYVSFTIFIHTSTNAKRLMKIGPVLVEIFGGICRFLPSCLKWCSFCPRNLWSYWINLDQICTRYRKILPLNTFEPELQ